MAGVVSLGKVRKQAVRKARLAQAGANVVKFDRSGAQNRAEATAAARQKAALDGKMRE